MRQFKMVIAALLGFAVVLGSGCSDTAPSGPTPGLGGVTVNKYVAVGSSVTAGYQSNGLYASAQQYSFPNLIAQQLTASGANLGSFELPWYSDPGTPGADGKASRYELINLVGPVIGPRGLSPGSPTNLALARPYDNLGIPGAVLYDFLDTTAFALKAGPPRNNPAFQVVLRNPALGKNVLAQAAALRPDLITFWLGYNDVLGFATSGGVSPSSPTDAATFQFLFGQSMDALKNALPNARIVVGNVPAISSLPFFTTVGPKMAAGIAAARSANPAVQGLFYQKHGERGVASGLTQLTEPNAPLITLTGSAYASILGSSTGLWYRKNGIPVAPPIDTTKPFGFHPQNPWPDALALDSDEQATAQTAVNAFNATIASVAAAKGAALADVNAFLANLRANGYSTAGQKFTSDYVSGGMFSLDGVHPSSKGQGIIANIFIDAMNRSFGMSLPHADLSTIPGIPAPLGKGTEGLPIIPPEAFRDLLN